MPHQKGGCLRTLLDDDLITFVAQICVTVNEPQPKFIVERRNGLSPKHPVVPYMLTTEISPLDANTRSRRWSPGEFYR
jgi:hypothetical protein